MNFFDEDLIAPLAAGIEKRVGGAVAKNVPWILRDLEKNIEDTKAEEMDLPVTVKLRVVGVSANRVKVIIDQIQWVRKIQRVEKGFQSLDVDLDQPLLPGLDDESQSAPTVVYDEDHDDMKSILRFAEKYSKKLMRLADPTDVNCRVLQVWKGDSGWENYPVETVEELYSMNELVAAEGGLVFASEGVLLLAAWDVIEDAGHVLYGRSEKGAIYNPRSAGPVTLDQDCVCVKMPYHCEKVTQPVVDAEIDTLDELEVGPDAADIAEVDAAASANADAADAPADPVVDATGNSESVNTVEEPKDEKWEALLAEAQNVIKDFPTVSEDLLQRCMNQTFATAGNLLDDLQSRGVVGAPLPPFGHRNVLKPAGDTEGEALPANATEAPDESDKPEATEVPAAVSDIEWWRVRSENAKKLFAAGIPCCCIMANDAKAVASSSNYGGQFTWQERGFATKASAKAYVRELREKLYVDPGIFAEDYDTVKAAGFAIIRKGLVYSDKTPIYTIRAQEGKGWSVQAKYPTEAERDTAFEKLLKDQNVLEG
jgi:hypothetical protein